MPYFEIYCFGSPNPPWFEQYVVNMIYLLFEPSMSDPPSRYLQHGEGERGVGFSNNTNYTIHDPDVCWWLMMLGAMVMMSWIGFGNASYVVVTILYWLCSNIWTCEKSLCSTSDSCFVLLMLLSIIVLHPPSFTATTTLTIWVRGGVQNCELRWKEGTGHLICPVLVRVYKSVYEFEIRPQVTHTFSCTCHQQVCCVESLQACCVESLQACVNVVLLKKKGNCFLCAMISEWHLGVVMDWIRIYRGGFYTSWSHPGI